MTQGLQIAKRIVWDLTEMLPTAWSKKIINFTLQHFAQLL